MVLSVSGELAEDAGSRFLQRSVRTHKIMRMNRETLKLHGAGPFL
jgi:hypothetical protein